MGRLPDNYLGPKQRITMLKNDYPKEKSAILTESCAWVVGEALCLLIKASIQIDGKTIAQGHAFTDCPEEPKAVEKAETIAIGRALVNAGYPETDDGEGEEVEEKKEEKEEKPKRSALGKSSKKEKEDESSDESEESDSEDSEKEESKPKKSGGLGKLSSKGSSSKGSGKSSSDDTEESDDESEESEEEEESDEKEESSDTEEGKKKLSREELLAKYRKK